MLGLEFHFGFLHSKTAPRTRSSSVATHQGVELETEEQHRHDRLLATRDTWDEGIVDS